MSILSQICIIFGVCLGGEVVAGILPFSFPASVAAMLILLLLLQARLLQLRQISQITTFLQQNMAFFFIPSGVNIIADVGLLSGSVVPFLLICIISTVVTFGVAAGTVCLVTRLQSRKTGGDII